MSAGDAFEREALGAGVAAVQHLLEQVGAHAGARGRAGRRPAGVGCSMRSCTQRRRAGSGMCMNSTPIAPNTSRAPRPPPRPPHPARDGAGARARAGRAAPRGSPTAGKRRSRAPARRQPCGRPAPPRPSAPRRVPPSVLTRACSRPTRQCYATARPCPQGDRSRRAGGAGGAEGDNPASAGGSWLAASHAASGWSVAGGHARRVGRSATDFPARSLPVGRMPHVASRKPSGRPGPARRSPALGPRPSSAGRRREPLRPLLRI